MEEPISLTYDLLKHRKRGSILPQLPPTHEARDNHPLGEEVESVEVLANVTITELPSSVIVDCCFEAHCGHNDYLNAGNQLRPLQAN